MRALLISGAWFTAADAKARHCARQLGALTSRGVHADATCSARCSDAWPRGAVRLGGRAPRMQSMTAAKSSRGSMAQGLSRRAPGLESREFDRLRRTVPRADTWGVSKIEQSAQKSATGPPEDEPPRRDAGRRVARAYCGCAARFCETASCATSAGGLRYTTTERRLWNSSSSRANTVTTLFPGLSGRSAAKSISAAPRATLRRGAPRPGRRRAPPPSRRRRSARPSRPASRASRRRTRPSSRRRS